MTERDVETITSVNEFVAKPHPHKTNDGHVRLNEIAKTPPPT